MKKCIALGLCFILMFSLAACGASSGSSKDGKVNLTFALWDTNQEPVMQQLAEAFTKENPNVSITIELTPFSQYWTKIETAATGNVLPDLFWMNGPNFIKYASNGMLLPIDDVVTNQKIDLSVYPQGLIDLYTYDKQLYGLPKDFDLTALWYNKKLFDDAGLAYPTNEWTWDDMVKAARVINNPDQGIYGTAVQTSTQQGIYNTVPQMGGHIISDDRLTSGHGLSESIKGIEVWRNLIDEGLSPTIEELSDTPAMDRFEAGQLGMLYAASWNVKRFMDNENVRDNVDLVIMPKLKERKAVIHGLIPAISAKSKNAETAKAFVAFLGSQEANQIWAESGVVIPAHKSVLDTWLASYPEINLKAFVDQLEYSVMYPTSRDNKWVEFERDTLRKVWAKEITVSEACKLISEEMNRLLEQEK